MRRLSVLFVFALVAMWAMGQESIYPKREMRATWLTTVANIDWPVSYTTDIDAQKSLILLNRQATFSSLRR